MVLEETTPASVVSFLLGRSFLVNAPELVLEKREFDPKADIQIDQALFR